MPDQNSKSVFISYRRSGGWPYARMIFQHLKSQGYDVFLDVESLEEGNYEHVILNQIEARAHFLVILTSDALRRCHEPDDLFRREIETALKSRRNVVPLMADNFSFHENEQYLTGRLQLLPQLNGLILHHEHFDDSMRRLQQNLLKDRTQIMLRVVPEEEQEIVERKMAAAHELAEEVIMQQFKRVNVAARSHVVRGQQFHIEGQIKHAIEEYSEAIRLDPNYVQAYYARADLLFSIENFEAAVEDYTNVGLLAPQDAGALYFRGLAYEKMGEYEQALRDYQNALQIDPTYPFAKPRLDSVKLWLKKNSSSHAGS
jgi:tetratricopeptide (TPR) repeat protein